MSDSTNQRGLSARSVERKTHNFLRQKKEQQERKVREEKALLEKRKQWTAQREEKQRDTVTTDGVERERRKRAEQLLEKVVQGQAEETPRDGRPQELDPHPADREDSRGRGTVGPSQNRDGFWRAGKWVQREPREGFGRGRGGFFRGRGGSSGPEATGPDGGRSQPDWKKIEEERLKKRQEKEKFKNLFKRKTSKGQPVMKHQINHLLAKIKGSMGK